MVMSNRNGHRSAVQMPAEQVSKYSKDYSYNKTYSKRLQLKEFWWQTGDDSN